MAITLKRLAEKMSKRVGQVSVYEADALSRKVKSVGKAVLTTSPIDTGRFVGGWQTKAGSVPSTSPSRTGQSPRSYNRMKRDRVSKQRTSEAVANAAQEEAASLSELNSVATAIQDGSKIIYLANNVPYAGHIDRIGTVHGPRKQGAGFVHRAVLRGEKARTGKLRKHVFTS